MGSRTITISIRMDYELKQQMETLCDKLGMSMATAYVIFTKRCVSEHGIPFRVTADPFYSESNMSFIREARAAIDRGEGEVHDLIE